MTRGGKREGAGRKPLPSHIKKRGVHIKLTGWVADWLQSREGQGVLIEEALIEKHNLEDPGPGVGQTSKK